MKKLLLISLLLPVTAFAFPKAPFNSFERELIDNTTSSQYDFEAIIKLSNCSASLIKFEGQPDSSKALMLTNGHCVKSFGFLKPGEVWINKRKSRRVQIFDSNMRKTTFYTTKILYATMTSTDSAIYELASSYEKIEKKTGVKPLMMNTNRPFINLDVEIISGYWSKGYSCHIDKFIPTLKEDDWTFSDSIKFSNTGCKTKGGTSGSPIISTSDRTVVGINNTGNESGERCKMNNPCEIDDEGEITVDAGASYGQQTYQFYGCLTLDFKIDPNISGCTLPK